jgi:hypothetical protein
MRPLGARASGPHCAVVEMEPTPIASAHDAIGVRTRTDRVGGGHHRRTNERTLYAAAHTMNGLGSSLFLSSVSQVKTLKSPNSRTNVLDKTSVRKL